MREICTSGSVRGGVGNDPTYSAVGPWERRRSGPISPDPQDGAAFPQGGVAKALRWAGTAAASAPTPGGNPRPPNGALSPKQVLSASPGNCLAWLVGSGWGEWIGRGHGVSILPVLGAHRHLDRLVARPGHWRAFAGGLKILGRGSTLAPLNLERWALP